MYRYSYILKVTRYFVVTCNMDTVLRWARIDVTLKRRLNWRNKQSIALFITSIQSSFERHVNPIPAQCSVHVTSNDKVTRYV